MMFNRRILPAVKVIAASRLAQRAAGVASMLLAAGCASTPTTEWWVSVPLSSAATFNQAVTEFNRAHAGQVVVFRNVESLGMLKQLNERLKKGAPPALVTLSQQEAASFAPDTFEPWASKLSPQLTRQVAPRLWDDPAGSERSLGLPVWGYQWISIANRQLLDKGSIAAVPGYFGAIARESKAFRAKAGADLWLPPFGDPDYVLGMLDLQKVPLLDGQKRPLFAGSEGRAAFRWWAEQFKQGTLPLACLDLTTAEALAKFKAGNVAMASGLPADVLSLDKKGPAAQSRVGSNRDISGTSEMSRTLVIGLYHPRMAPKSMAMQNFAAQLLQPEWQRALANAVNAVPVCPGAVDHEKVGKPAGGNDLVRFNLVAYDFVRDSTTTLGGFRERRYLAKALRDAFVAVCRDGADPEKTLDQAAKQYQAHFTASGG